jgi:hypothetical protein
MNAFHQRAPRLGAAGGVIDSIDALARLVWLGPLRRRGAAQG